MLLLFTHFAFEAERYEDEVPEKKVHRLKPVLVHPNSLCLSKLSRCESQKVSRVVAFN